MDHTEATTETLSPTSSAGTAGITGAEVAVSSSRRSIPITSPSCLATELVQRSWPKRRGCCTQWRI